MIDPRLRPSGATSTATVVPVGPSIESQLRAFAAVLLAASVAAVLRATAALSDAHGRSGADELGRVDGSDPR